MKEGEKLHRARRLGWAGHSKQLQYERGKPFTAHSVMRLQNDELAIIPTMQL